MRRRFLGLALAVLAGALLADGARADEMGRVAEGERLYWQHCATCHGPEGRGDGPLAPALKSKPRDLTRLQQANGGRFDAESVARYVDGRKNLVSHGNTEMPAWGEWGVFRSSPPAADPRTPAERRMRDLLLYLRAIQVSEPAP